MGDSVSRKVHDRARNRATQRLRELHNVEYWVIFDQEVAKAREELGWEDGRPAANRRKGEQARDEDGQFKKT